MYTRSYDLPWALSLHDDRRFRKILLWTLGVTLVLSILLAALPVRDKATLAPPQLPPRMAKLLLEPKPKPPVPKPIDKPQPAKIVKATERPVVVPKPKPQPAPVQGPEAPVLKPAPAARDVAREQASQAGVMAFADQLTDLRDAVADTSLSLDTTQAATGDAPAQRNLVTSASGTRSGGIDTSAMSRATGGGGLASRQTTRVTNTTPTPRAPASSKTTTDTASNARSREEIEQVFDRNKAAIYALYRRALRSNPTLEGKVVLTLTIAPSGAVTSIDILSSELAAPDLEAKLLRRIRMFDFGARDVAVTTTTKPIDFVPA